MSRPSTQAEVEARFWAKVAGRSDPVDCWEWLASRGESGYGRLRFNGKEVKAHRYAYELLVGPIPEGLDLDHLCRNRGCVNPRHLEPVTRSVNLRRSPLIHPGHCPQGHLYDDENSYFERTKKGYVTRKCRECRKILSRRWYERKRAARAS